MSSDNPVDLSSLFGSPEPAAKTEPEIKAEDEARVEAFIENPELHELGQKLEAARNDRHVNDIPLKDPYWDAQNELQKYYRKHK